jgi:hypothetical protein
VRQDGNVARLRQDPIGARSNGAGGCGTGAAIPGQNLEDAARSAGIGPATLRRWQELPEFDKAFRRARRQAFGQQINRLQHASAAAVTTLHKLVVDATSAPAVKARAAYYIITLGNKAIEIDDIEQRLTELERAAEDSKQSR